MRARLPGRPGAPGHALGTPVVIDRHDPTAPAEPVMGLDEAVRATAARFVDQAERAEQAGRRDEAEVLQAYEMLVTDPTLIDGIKARTTDGAAVPDAIAASAAELAEQLAALDNEYLAQRAEDVRGAAEQLTRTLLGQAVQAGELPEDAVICALELTPADTVELDLARVRGFATEQGGPTSHTAIIARSLGLPAVVGADGLLAAASEGQRILLDGHRGTATIDPTDDEVQQARQRLEDSDRRAERHRSLRGREVAFGGQRILVAANVGALDDVERAREVEADGIGLFRSEFLFLGRDHAPDVAEQAAVYRAAVEGFDDPVVVRTLDIGGDKEIAYLALAHEANPFLGIRGLRLCLQEPELFATQLDALLTLAHDPALRIMFPMVATERDLLEGLAVLRARAEAAGAPMPQAGAMIETPAAALMARQLCRHADFLSIGTNDLVQYTMAADRTEGRLGAYQDPLEPAVLRLVAETTRAGEDSATPVAVCGEAAADPAAAIILLGLGVNELSVAPAAVDEIRWLVSEVDDQACRDLARRALDAPDAPAVREAAVAVLPGA